LEDEHFWEERDKGEKAWGAYNSYSQLAVALPSSPVHLISKLESTT